jgi:hypothetical protein
MQGWLALYASHHQPATDRPPPAAMTEVSATPKLAVGARNSKCRSAVGSVRHGRKGQLAVRSDQQKGGASASGQVGLSGQVDSLCGAGKPGDDVSPWPACPPCSPASWRHWACSRTPGRQRTATGPSFWPKSARTTQRANPNGTCWNRPITWRRRRWQRCATPSAQTEICSTHGCANALRRCTCLKPGSTACCCCQPTGSGSRTKTCASPTSQRASRLRRASRPRC